MGSTVNRFAKAAEEMRRRAWGARQALDRLGTRVSVEGRGNDIDIRQARLNRVQVIVEGNDNVVRIHPTCRLVGATFRLVGDGLRIELGQNVKVSRWADFRLTGNGASIELERDCTVEGARFIAREGTHIQLGPECMLAYEVEIRTTDSHSIMDGSTGERINPDQSVVVGKHVWVGARTTILKGVSIGEDSVIATGSIVSKDIGSGVVAGGVPARVLRTGVNWDRRQI